MVGLCAMIPAATGDVSDGGVAGLAILGIAVGGAGGWAQKKYLGWTEEECGKSYLLKIGGGIASFVPWVIAGCMYQDRNHQS